MRPEPRVTPFRWIFPLAQLFLCAVILWPMRSMLVGQIRASLREYGISHDTAARNPVTPRLRPFNLDLSDPDVQRRIKIVEAREWAVAALNVCVRGTHLAGKIHDFRSTKGLAMVQIRYRRGFETKSEAFT